MIDRTFTIISTIAQLRSMPGQYLPRYAWLLDLGAPFKWVLGSTATDDGFSAVVPLVGGYQGAWLRLSADDSGADLPDANATITVGGGFWRTLPTLTANRVLTLDPTGAQPGMPIEVTRTDASAYTYTIKTLSNVTLCVMPAGSKAFALAHVKGSDFVLRRSALML